MLCERFCVWCSVLRTEAVLPLEPAVISKSDAVLEDDDAHCRTRRSRPLFFTMEINSLLSRPNALHAFAKSSGSIR